MNAAALQPYKSEMKSNLPETEQLATLTARLVGAGIVPRLNDPNQMFRAALDYWRSCERFLEEQRSAGTQENAAGGPRLESSSGNAQNVPKPPKFPVPFAWLLSNLFEGERDLLHHYIEHCQTCGAFPAGDVESLVAPLLDGTDVEGYSHFSRLWHQWRQVRTGVTRVGAPSKRPTKKPAARKASGKSGHSRR